MEDKDRIELLRWLITRSDTMRATYSGRAALILSANAIILAAIVFLMDKNLGQSAGDLRFTITIFAALSLFTMLFSLAFAFTASISPRSSRRATNFQGSKRIFFNPSETFAHDSVGNDFGDFRDKFENITTREIIESGCGEFWVDLKLQQVRYARLKNSVWFILASFVFLVVTLLLTLFR